MHALNCYPSLKFKIHKVGHVTEAMSTYGVICSHYATRDILWLCTKFEVRSFICSKYIHGVQQHVEIRLILKQQAATWVIYNA